ncbi:MAG: acriflavin resistance protein, partial [Propionibacteriaceae bacterium]|nr:acriflavin resistance protein [Propionibacteriaceae bacterium]
MARFLAGVMKFRLLILAAAIGILAMYAEIQTEALGLSAEEVEQLITVPLEQDLLNGVEGVDLIRSESLPGLSSIVMVFEPGTDIYRGRQLIEERLTQAHALPNVSKPPTLLQPLSSANRVVMIGMNTTELTPIEQSVIARWTVRPRLMGVPGVANVSIWGLRDQQLQVQVDPQVLRARNVTLNQVVSTAGNAQVVSQLSFLEASTPGAGGFIETPQQRLQVRHLLEKLTDPAEVAKVPVEGAANLTLGDVAQVKVDHQPLIGDAVVNGGPGLIMVVEKFPGANTADVTKGVQDALEGLRPGLTGIKIDTSWFAPSDYLEAAADNLGLAIAFGAGLLLLTLLALRFHWRAVIVGVITVPVSVISAALVLHLLGYGLNALVIAGLAAAVAIAVDEAVAPQAAVLGRLRDRSASPDAEPTWVAIQQALATVRRPLIYAGIIALLAILPMAVLEGRPGAFFSPMVVAYAAAVVAALIVGMTVGPALNSLLFARWQPKAGSASGPVAWLGARYRSGLQKFSRSLRPALFVAAACGLVAAVILPFLNTALTPTFQDRNVVVKLQGAPDASAPAITQRATEIGNSLQALPGVSGVGTTIGRAITGDRVVNVNSGDIWVAIAGDADYDATVASIKDTVRDVPGMTAEVVPFSTQEMREVGSLETGTNTVTGSGLDVLTGLNTPVAVRVYGEEPQVLAAEAAKVQQLMSTIDGVVNPRVEGALSQPTIEIEVDLDKAQQVGITPGAVRRAEATLLQGIQVGSVFEDQKVFDVIVLGTPATRSSVAAVQSLLIDRPGGSHVRLGDVAEVRIAQTPTTIHREAVSRHLDVVADLDGRSVGAVAADLEQQLADTSFPLQYHAEVIANSTADEIQIGRVIGFGIAAIIAAFLLFQAAFNSWRLALVATAALPLSLTGGLLTGVIGGRTFGLGALLGMLALLGLAARYIAMMLTTIQGPDGRRRSEDDAATVHGRAGESFGPLLTSAAALAAVALPFVVLGPRPGLEIL